MKPIFSRFALPAFCAALSVLAFPAAARANDGGIAWGGSPSLLKSHRSIAMESEVVRITVGEENAIVDCRFVFKNNGPTTTVRMGFPDDGEGESGFYQGPQEWKTARPASGFNWFKSWVDGAPVKTSLVKSSEPGKVWHAKAVAFGANARRVVRDQYSVPLGSQIVRDGIYRQTAYTLHTGSSWAGNIGRSEILVRFDRNLGASRVRAVPFSQVPYVVSMGDKDPVFAKAMKPGVVVVYSAPGTAQARGKTLRWVRTNWRPAPKDDVRIFFDFQSFTKLRAESDARTARLPYVNVYPVKRRLTANDVNGLSSTELRQMRNAIYARRGRPFQDAAMARFFASKSWYRPKANWTEADENRPLGAIDEANAAFLLNFEKR